MLVDTHCHLVNEDYNIDEIIRRAGENDVKYLIVGGSDREDNKLNLKIPLKYDNVFLSIGYHPSMASSVTEDDINFLKECLMKDDKKIVAIGEIGLDYHYGKEEISEQKELFRKQLEIAEKYNKPVVIHTRDAFLDTYNILKEYNVKGVIHCFSGSLEVARKYIDLGFFLGIGGVVTFKNSNLKDVVKEIGLDKIVFETDSPYLSPMRGKKNEPGNIKIICGFVSELLNMSYNDVANITTTNADKLFNITEQNTV